MKISSNSKCRQIVDSKYVKSLDEEQVFSQVKSVRRLRISRSMLISFKTTWRVVWDYFIMLLAFFNCLMVPLEIAIELEYTKTVAYSFYSISTDTIFFLDILVQFNTTLDENSEEIKDRVLIAKHYLRGSFTVDFLSAFPFDSAANLLIGDLSTKQLKVLSLLKLIRMLRLSKIVRVMKVNRDFKAQLKIVILALKLALYFHCSACLQLWVINYEALWDNPVYSRAPQWQGKFYTDTFMQRYLVCICYAMIIHKGKNVLPLTTLQAAIDIASMFLAIIVYGQFIGQFGEIVFEMSEKRIQIERISNSFVVTLEQFDLPQKVQDQAQAYIKLVSLIDYY